jgi:hypothetical protein
VRSLKNDRRALASPFEDLPALMVVSIGVVILLVSMANAFYSWDESVKDGPEEIIDDLVFALRNYEKLTENGMGQGIFSSLKLGSLNATLITMDLNLGYELRIEITEVSSYSTDMTYSSQTSPLPDVSRKEIVWDTTAIGIFYNGQVHAGTMNVAIWGYE